MTPIPFWNPQTINAMAKQVCLFEVPRHMGAALGAGMYAFNGAYDHDRVEPIAFAKSADNIRNGGSRTFRTAIMSLQFLIGRVQNHA